MKKYFIYNKNINKILLVIVYKKNFWTVLIRKKKNDPIQYLYSINHNYIKYE